jgi:hypothetical protein
MDRTARTDYHSTRQVSINAAAVANKLITIAEAELAERDEQGSLVVVDEAVGTVLSDYHIDTWERFEAAYLVEWLTAEYDLHPTALTAHVVEDASEPAFGPVIDRLVDTALRHLVRQEVLDENLSHGVDPNHGNVTTPPDIVGIDTGWFPMAPAFETVGRLVHDTESDVRTAAQTTVEVHYPFYLRLSLTEQAALIEHLIRSKATDGTIEVGRAQEAAREGLGQLFATFLWFTLEDAIVQSIKRHFDYNDQH